MCGIVAIVNKEDNYLPEEATSIFKQLLYADALRGWDSTGMFKLGYQDEPEIYKKATTPQTFLWHVSDKHKHMLGGKILVGHNRAATKGTVADENAHPFKEDNITLVHNGTIFGHRTLKNTEVDSHAITHALNEKTTQELVNQLNGAYALVWWDKRKKTLNLLRNKERPLSIIETDKYYIISSELKLAEWIADRNNLNVEKTTELLPFTHYTLSINNKKMILEAEVLTEPKKIYYHTSFEKSPKRKEAEAKLEKKLKELNYTKDNTYRAIVYDNIPRTNSSHWTEHWGYIEGYPDIDVNFYFPRALEEGSLIEFNFSNILSMEDTQEAYIFGSQVKFLEKKFQKKRTTNLLLLH